MAATAARALAFLGVLVMANCLVMDEEATKDVISTARTSLNHGGELVLLVPPPQGRNTTREELLHAKGADETAIWLFFNKKSNKVTLETLHGGHIKSISWGLGSHPRGTLLLVVTSYRVKLQINCKALHWHELSGTYDLLEILSSKKLKVYHEETASIKVFSSEKSALDSFSCSEDAIKPPPLISVDEYPNPPSDVIEVKSFIKNEERRKYEQMQGDQYRDNFITNDPRTSTERLRGDIPSSAIESCDDEVIRQLQLLRQTIEHLRREVGDQKGIIDDLRKRLSQCCNRPNPPPPVERCSSGSCYPGY